MIIPTSRSSSPKDGAACRIELDQLAVTANSAGHHDLRLRRQSHPRRMLRPGRAAAKLSKVGSADPAPGLPRATAWTRPSRTIAGRRPRLGVVLSCRVWLNAASSSPAATYVLLALLPPACRPSSSRHAAELATLADITAAPKVDREGSRTTAEHARA